MASLDTPLAAPPPGAAVGPGARRLRAARARWVAVPMALRVFILSRLLVLAAGVLGLAAGRHPGWEVFDSSGVSAGLGGVGNQLAAASVRWDAIHYLAIASHGYQSASATAFFPLYPLLVGALGWLCGSTVVAGIAISLIAFALALVLLHRLAELELGREVADVTVALLAFAPLSFFFSAVYTESLFLALTVGCFLAARRGHWGWAIVLSAAAAATRVTGVLLAPALLVAWWQAPPRPRWAGWGSVAAPAALIAFLSGCAAAGYGFLAPVHQQTASAHAHVMSGPLVATWLALRDAARGVAALVGGHAPLLAPSVAGVLSAPAENVMLFGILALALVTAATALRRLPGPYGVYVVGSLLVECWSPVSGRPLSSLDRYCLTLFPLWMAAATLMSDSRVRVRLLVGSAVLLVVASAEFAAWAFVA